MRSYASARGIFYNFVGSFFLSSGFYEVMHVSTDIGPVSSGAKFLASARRAWPFPLSRIALAAVCTFLVAILAYLDYLTGYEQSLLLFYLVPIALATWFGGLVYGLIFSVLSVGVWVISDLVAGIPTVGAWNLIMALAAYVVFAVLLSKLRAVL